ncbi:MAG TPA: HAD family hydrolase, partial [Aggregatilineales bacterium]|nr:HAD family hydrolase [Aggregatilineales bacterium]
MNKPRAILFDLDDTILNDTGDNQHCWELACEIYAPQLGGISSIELLTAIETYRRWYWDDPERHRSGRLNMVEARRHIVTVAIQQLGVDSPEIACRLADYHTGLREELLAPFAGALETLQQVQKQDIRTALITNGSGSAQRRKIERFNLASYFDCILVEGEFGVGKPDPQVYLHAIASLNVQPNQTWMIGDNLEWDVAAPQR